MICLLGSIVIEDEEKTNCLIIKILKVNTILEFIQKTFLDLLNIKKNEYMVSDTN